ncbi:hypothetical protein FBEOM_12713 [Fusarium beomiforme]|uniref:Uncharacterized protein n=1 Tax=Fusarium beomiforme TaxID=44412 RepID=A0A9P5DP67_9HYPO|nr:hypothetical protein FBEOM_12713 [Fusarium beomiforme]
MSSSSQRWVLALQHITQYSIVHGRECTVPFPGLEPSTEERYRYVEDFCSSYFPRENTAETRKLLRKEATIIAAKLLLKGNRVAVKIPWFVWEVDKVFWNLCHRFTPKRETCLAMAKPSNASRGREILDSLFETQKDHDRDGDLDINRDSVPEEEKHTESPSQHGTESPVMKFLGRDGMHYPLPMPTQSLYDRRTIWGALYPGVTPPAQPFTLLLPGAFDFWTFVWGPNGSDFNKIRSRFAKERIEVTWKYQEALPGTKVDDKDPIDPEKLPERAHILAIGPANRQAVKNGEFLLIGLQPINADGIGRLWDEIRAWYFDCTMDRITTLRSHLENVAQARKARVL